MKVAVLGYGNVGMTVFNAFLHMPEIHELVLCGRNTKRIEGEIADALDSLALTPGINMKIGGGGYEMTEGADIIIYTIGAAVKDVTQGRLALTNENVRIACEVSSELNRYNRNAVIVVISNPVDVIVSALVKYSGRPRCKVIGTGTLLDTARLKRYLADLLDIRPRNITTFVLGEHGDSSCIIWSWTRVLGMSIDAFFSSQTGAKVKLSREKLHEYTKRAGYTIFEKKGSTSFGVAASAAQIVSAVIHNTHEILPVSVYLEGEYGIDGVALSVPCYVCSAGASVIPGVKFSEDELNELKASAEIIRRSSELQ